MLKIGDEVSIHGYVDEIRLDTIIIKNKGGYFGTIKDEINRDDQYIKEWVIEHNGNGWNDWINLICPYCNTKYEEIGWYTKWNFCPNCGKKLELNKEKI